MFIDMHPSRFLALAALVAGAAQAQRPMAPTDLFRVERASAITWSPDGNRASVELRRPGKVLDNTVPTAEIAIVDATTGALRPVSSPSAAFMGFFGAAWSPDGRRVAFLSADTNGTLRPWVWTIGAPRATMVVGLRVREASGDGPLVSWRDSTTLILHVRGADSPDDGLIYSRITRGKNSAEAWQRVRSGRGAVVQVLDAGVAQTLGAESRIVAVDVRNGAAKPLATGLLRLARLSADRATITFRREQPARASSFFGPTAQGDASYDEVNGGGTVHYIDARTGAETVAPDTARARPAAPRHTLRAENDPASGSRLTLIRAGKPDTIVWRGNAWMRDVQFGRSESVAYTALDGTRLTGWVLYPPGYSPGRPSPAITVVYPGTIYGAREPASFSPFFDSFEHQQMLAALGYVVVLPSMPEAERPMQTRSLDALTGGVLPLLDTLATRGVVDSSRIAVLGQSAGGHAVLGLVTRTNRFRTGIASASYSDQNSLYGAFYGQFRFGDGGHPLRAQLLRMLQFERGYYGADATPWERPERYFDNSPIVDVAKVQTPVMLVHGEQDFIPIQQAEQFFTALYRMDKRARLVRYAGEGHTISGRENVLDLWARIPAWLKETM